MNFLFEHFFKEVIRIALMMILTANFLLENLFIILKQVLNLKKKEEEKIVGPPLRSNICVCLNASYSIVLY
jgi:hypothetical protein